MTEATNSHERLWKVLGVTLLVILFVAGCVKKDSERRVDRLWSQTVQPLLLEDIWAPETSYDASNSLMLPLHFAFSKDGSEGQRHQFRKMMQRHLDNTTILFDDNTLRVAQFSYLVSQYLVLSDYLQYWGETEQQLYSRLLSLVEFFWLYRIRYDVTFKYKFAGLSQRVAWKARSASTTPHHNRAVVDEEWFVMAISADLARIARAEALGKQGMLDRIMAESCSAVEKAGVFYDDGRWRFQPGVWSTHPDYLFAGNAEVTKSLKPAPVEDIGLDSGHAHRFPLWLRSLTAGSEGQCKALFERAQDGFRRQFFEKVLVNKDHALPQLRNFLDGSNGVYRYGYKTLGADAGYGPNELSGTLVLGWYAFLGGESLHQAFRQLLSGLPFGSSELRLLIGPSTSRQRHEFFLSDNYWVSGFAELHVLLGLQLLAGAGAGAGAGAADGE